MDVIVGKDLQITNPSADLMQWVKQNFVLDNPEYYKKKMRGIWVGNLSRDIQLYEKVGQKIVLPFGALRELYQRYPHATYTPVFCPIRRFDYQSNIKPYDYQETAIQAAMQRKNGIIVMPCGAGKGLPLDAKIYTPTGWKRNGDLKIGDKVIGSDGNETEVTGIFDKGLVDAYKITFSDETEIICDADHLWTVQKQSQRAESKNWFVTDAKKIYKHYKEMKCRSQYLYIPIVEPVNFKKQKITLNPWLLGFLLGDGCFQKTAVTMSTNENDLRKKVVDIIYKTYGSKEKLNHHEKYDYRFTGGCILHDIKKLGLEKKHSYEKFIPQEYKYNSIKVRLAILQGLFDADGYVNKSIFEYSTTSKQLADDIVEIIESLGGTAKIHVKQPKYIYNGEKRIGRTAYRIFFKLYKFKPFSSDKHEKAYKERKKYSSAYRIIKKIEPCKKIVSRCITVSAKDELYVTDHFIVTHNTSCGLEIISRVGGRALWLTHTQDLLNQSKDRACSFLNCDKSSYGTITGGKVNISDGITFATVQTMWKLDLSKYRDTWDVIITDEVHHAAGSPTKVTQFYKVLTNLCARYKIGLTATPHRADGLERSMFALLGDIIHEVPKEAVASKTCPVHVDIRQTGYMPNPDEITSFDGTLDYHALVADLVNNQSRFELVLSDVQEIAKNNPVLVLANRVEYLNRLSEFLNHAGIKSVCLSKLGASKKAKELRKNSLHDLNSGAINCICASYQLAREGLDVPNLRYIVLATPEKDFSTVVQSAGRVGRKADGKEYGTVIDYVDDFGMYQSWAKKRTSMYKKLGYNIL